MIRNLAPQTRQQKTTADRWWVQRMILIRLTRLDREDIEAGRPNKFRCAKHLRIPPYWRTRERVAARRTEVRFEKDWGRDESLVDT